MYTAYYYTDKKWIGFQLQKKKIRQNKHKKIRQKNIKTNNDNTLGYKIHIVIPKDDNYENNLKKVIEILSKYKLFFKIDAHLKSEKSGDRAFTLYLPHQYNPYWFEALKKIDEYLMGVLQNKKAPPRTYSPDKTAKRVSGFRNIRYRNDRDPHGRYHRNWFNHACEKSVANPFRPALIKILNKIYKHNNELYKNISIQMHNDIGYGEFLIRLHKNNESEFFNLLERISKDPQLYRMISNLSWYAIESGDNKYFTLAENLVKDPAAYETIMGKLADKSSCPTYHALATTLQEHNKKYDNNTPLSIEAYKIAKANKAITVSAMYSTFVERKSFNELESVNILTQEINQKLVNNDNLKVDQSAGEKLATTLLNILHAVPIGWGFGFYKLYHTGTFFYSYKKKIEPHKEIESDLLSALKTNNILNTN